MTFKRSPSRRVLEKAEKFESLDAMEQITDWSTAWQKFESGASHIAENNLAASTQKSMADFRKWWSWNMQPLRNCDLPSS
jgi:hypothetical protein